MNILKRKIKLKHELSYLNNSRSLFRKYAPLVTAFSNSPEGRYFLSQKKFFKPQGKISLFLPNGWHEKIGENRYRATFTTRPVFSPLLYRTLTKIDLAKRNYPMLRGKDLLEMMFIDLGLRGFSTQYPQVFLATTDFNPDADPESTTVDGYVGRWHDDLGSTAESWANIRTGSGTRATDNAGGYRAYTKDNNTNWTRLSRGIALYDTSSLGGGAIINSVDEKYYVTGKNDNHAQNLDVVSSNPASNTGLANSDYDLNDFGTTLWASLDITNITLDQYNTWTFNSTGISNINKTGITKTGSRLSGDRTNTEPSKANNASDVTVHYAESTNVPILTIDYIGNPYSRGDEASLPGDDTDLETIYSSSEETDISASNDTRVAQTGTNQYILHQFKDDIGASPSVNLTCEVQTTWAPSSNTVFLQIYNRNTASWDNVDSNNTASVNTDFTLSGNIADTTDYVDGDGFISCRVYQQATF